MRKFVLTLAALLAMTCSSCGSKNLFPVSGRVTCKGAPAAGAVVFFHRAGGDTMNDHQVMGVVQEDGSFELVCGSLGKGAPPGEYDVLIEWKQPGEQATGRSRRGPDRLNGRYADLKEPRFHVVVKTARNELAPFEVE